jgi:hypothetical protein
VELKRFDYNYSDALCRFYGDFEVLFQVFFPVVMELDFSVLSFNSFGSLFLYRFMSITYLIGFP